MDRRQFLRATGASAVAGLAAVAGCSGGGDQDATTTSLPEDTELVEVAPGGDYVFVPETITVDAGTTVLWKWYDSGHDVAPEDQPADADWQGHPELEGTGFEYEYEFTVPGTYDYICTPHERMGMVGSVVVEG